MNTLTLVYFGAGWDLLPLSQKDYRAFNEFIFVDALPDSNYYGSDCAGYKFSQNRLVFIEKIVQEALRRKYKRTDKNDDDCLHFIGPRGQKFEYYINTSVQAAVNDPEIKRKIYTAKWLHVEGFYPFQHGLIFERDMPNLCVDLATLRRELNDNRVQLISKVPKN